MEEIRKELNEIKLILVMMRMEGQLEGKCDNYLKLHEAITNLTKLVE